MGVLFAAQCTCTVHATHPQLLLLFLPPTVGPNSFLHIPSRQTANRMYASAPSAHNHSTPTPLHTHHSKSARRHQCGFTRTTASFSEGWQRVRVGPLQKHQTTHQCGFKRTTASFSEGWQRVRVGSVCCSQSLHTHSTPPTTPKAPNDTPVRVNKENNIILRRLATPEGKVSCSRQFSTLQASSLHVAHPPLTGKEAKRSMNSRLHCILVHAAETSRSM